MSNKIQVKRGLRANLPILDIGEPALTIDDKKVHIGTESGNVELATNKQVTDIINGTTVVAKASTLETPRSINGVNFNGSANITVTAAANGGTSAACSGNSATATKLQTPRTINGVAFDGTANITVADGTKAPTSHASSGTGYGIGTQSNYGHMALQASLTQANYQDGLALSGHLGKVLNDKIFTAQPILLGTFNLSATTAVDLTNYIKSTLYDRYLFVMFGTINITNTKASNVDFTIGLATSSNIGNGVEAFNACQISLLPSSNATHTLDVVVDCRKNFHHNSFTSPVSSYVEYRVVNNTGKFDMDTATGTTRMLYFRPYIYSGNQSSISFTGNITLLIYGINYAI